MDLSSIAGSITLRHGRPLRLSNIQGRRISVMEGQVWVTQDRDPRDVVLVAGDEYTFDRPGAIVSALEEDAHILREDGVNIDAGGSRQRNLFQRALARFWHD